MQTPVDAYIAGFPAEVQVVLNDLRRLIRESAPDAVESISYGIATYKLHKKALIYFGGWKEHVGLYATPSGHTAFKDELSRYKGAKGSVRLPLDEPMPWDLIRRIVAFRVAELNAANPPAKRPRAKA